MTTSAHRSTLSWLLVVGVALMLGIAATPFPSRSQTTPDGSPLPETTTEIVVDAEESQMYLLGIPDMLGEPGDVGEVLRNDFKLMAGYRVIDLRSIHHDLNEEGLGIRAGAWAALNANGVIKGQLRETEGGAQLSSAGQARVAILQGRDLDVDAQRPQPLRGACCPAPARFVTIQQQRNADTEAGDQRGRAGGDPEAAGEERPAGAAQIAADECKKALEIGAIPGTDRKSVV